MIDKTIEYYNQNAEHFYETTVGADMSLQLERFVKYLPAEGHVLDAGCGSGRDSLYLMDKGYTVEAFDASEEMCRYASELIGKQVRLCRFEDIDYRAQFDGIWACASLVHVSMEDMSIVVGKLYEALKENGVLYASFKKGSGERYRGERKFTDVDEEYLHQIIDPFFDVTEIRESRDVRPGRDDEIWMNVFAQKVNCQSASE